MENESEILKARLAEKEDNLRSRFWV